MMPGKHPLRTLCMRSVAIVLFMALVSWRGSAWALAIRLRFFASRTAAKARFETDLAANTASAGFRTAVWWRSGPTFAKIKPRAEVDSGGGRWQFKKA